MQNYPLPETNDELAVLMREKLGLRGRDTLAVKMRRGGRLLPRAERRDGQYLVETETLWQNPRLRRQVDLQKVKQAQSNLRAHLRTINPRDRLVGQIIGIAAPLAFNLLLVFALFVAWLVWSGRV